jgi:hypothetical protein
MKTNIQYDNNSFNFFFVIKNFSDKFVEKITTRILCSIFFFFPKIVPLARYCRKIL